MIKCIHQLMPPKFRAPKWMGLNLEWGDCHMCISDIANKHCPGFTPIEVMTKISRELE